MSSIEAPAGPGGGAAGAATPRYFDLSLRLDGRPCLVVGGGAVAARKAGLLLEAGAAVTVVAPERGAELQALHAAGALARLERRPFAPEDAAGHVLAVAATDDPQVNAAVAAACRQRGVLVNVADDPEAGDFVVPATVRRGPLHLTVSTSGLAPAVAAAVARRLAERYGEEWGEVVALLGAERERAREAGLEAAARRALAQELAALDFDALLADGGLERVREAAADCAAGYGLVPPGAQAPPAGPRAGQRAMKREDPPPEARPTAPQADLQTDSSAPQAD